jgi:hypothetical protein
MYDEGGGVALSNFCGNETRKNNPLLLNVGLIRPTVLAVKKDKNLQLPGAR